MSIWRPVKSVKEGSGNDSLREKSDEHNWKIVKGEDQKVRFPLHKLFFYKLMSMSGVKCWTALCQNKLVKKDFNIVLEEATSVTQKALLAARMSNAIRLDQASLDTCPTEGIQSTLLWCWGQN